jgi:hypothetical protein
VTERRTTKRGTRAPLRSAGALSAVGGENNMGTWGEQLLDNDDALDLEQLWDQFVIPNVNSCPHLWTSQMVVDLFLKMYFHNEIDFSDSVCRKEILALGALLKKQFSDIPEEFKLSLSTAACIELKKDNLDEHKSPRKRKNILVKLLKDIDMEPIEYKDPKLDELIALKEFTKDFNRWIKLVKAPKHDDDFSRLFPPFLDDVRKLVKKGAPQLTDLGCKITQQRMMLLAFWITWKIECDEKEIMALIQKAKDTNGIVWLFS